MGENGYAISPYTGCSHNCSWPGAKCWYTSMQERFGRKIDRPYPVENFLELLDKDLEKMEPGLVLMSNTTDPFQFMESSLHLSYEALKRLFEKGWTVIILTKSHIVERYFDLLVKYKKQVWVGMSLTSPQWAKQYENASSHYQRVGVLREAKRRGLKTWISYEPIDPEYSSKNMVQEIEYLNPDFVVFGSLNKNGKPVFDYSEVVRNLIDETNVLNTPLYFKDELVTNKNKGVQQWNRVPWLVNKMQFLEINEMNRDVVLELFELYEEECVVYTKQGRIPIKCCVCFKEIRVDDISILPGKGDAFAIFSHSNCPCLLLAMEYKNREE
jgi:DNA repair photolyase